MSTTNGSGAGGATRDPEADRATLRAVHAAAQGGDMDRASLMAEQALKTGLEHPLLLNLVALKLENEGRLEEAVARLRRARELAPGDISVLNALGLVLQRLEGFRESLELFEEVLRLAPDFPPGHYNRGAALDALGRLEPAEASYRRALELQPGHLAAMAGLASIAGRRGQHQEARRLAEPVLEREPNYPDATMTVAAADLAEGAAARAEARIRALLADPRPSLLERALATSLLGDALDAQGRIAPAFEAYSGAGRELKRVYAERFGRGESTLDAAVWLNRAFAAARPETWAPRPATGTNPDGAAGHVFLTGFPRSGTTLLEQVLASHPGVIALEEQDTLVDAVRAFMRAPTDLDRLAAAGDGDLVPFREAYWRRVREAGVDPAGKVFVDKHPLNTLKLPLIARLFPEARILFARRDPRDVVLSCFRRRFQMNAPMYQLLTLESAAAFYAATMQLAARLDQVLALDSLEVRHESLVADFEREVRAICGFLGLEWTEAMHGFADRTRDRGIATPSGAQLARGLNAEGVGAGRQGQQLARLRGGHGSVLTTHRPGLTRCGQRPVKRDFAQLGA